MTRKHDVLERLAAHVADSESVDWKAEVREHPDLEDHLVGLRIIEGIGLAHARAAGLETLDTETDATLVPLTAEEPTLGKSWGGLEIVEEIARGANGRVYRAFDPNLQLEVALKLLRSGKRSSDRSDEFMREARQLAKVRHPNVLAVLGVEEHDGRIGLWTELIEGSTLETLLRQQGPLNASEATLIGIDLCRALAAVHAAGLVHSDVKTSNVMREKGGRIVLMDFGSVRDSAGPDSERVGGTPSYMAPEQLAGGPATARSDVYALAVLLYRLVSGQFPLEADSLSDLMTKHRNAESVPLRDVRPDLPSSLVRIIERSLAPDPSERYSSVGEMERGLGAFLSPSPQPEPRFPVWLKAWFQGIVAIAIASVLLLGGFLLLRPTDLQVNASLFRSRMGVEERLLEGSTVAPGDDLFLEIAGSGEMHVYIFNEDEQGSSFLLFPLPGFERGNPLPADVLHRLPGRISGVERYWEVSSSGGRENILVVASRDPLPDLEGTASELQGAGQSASAEEQAALDTLRGIGGLSDSGSGAEAGLLGQILAGLKEQAETDDGLWIWNLELKNPEG